MEAVKILKINGFTGKGNKKIRSDGFEVSLGKEKYIANWNGKVIYLKSKEEVIGYLAIHGIINRLF